MKKTSFNQRFDNVISQSKFDFYKSFKYFILSTLILIIAGIFIFSFLGFNLGNDFASLSSIKVYTNSENYIQDTINSYDIDDSEDYNKVINLISNALSKNGTQIESVEKTTIDLKNENIKDAKALEIIYYNDSSLTKEEQTNLNSEIKTAIMQALGYQNEDAVLLEEAVSEPSILENYNQNLTIVYSCIIAIVVAIVFTIIYLACRYEKTAFVTAFITIVHDILLMLALIAITRLPFNLSTLAVVGFTMFMSVINLLVFYSKSKEMTSSGAVDQSKANCVANEVSKSNIKLNLYLYAILFVLSIILIAFSTAVMRYTALALSISVIVNFVSAQFILPGFYAIVYKPIKKNRKFI